MPKNVGCCPWSTAATEGFVSKIADWNFCTTVFRIWQIWNIKILPEIVWWAFCPFDTAICISSFISSHPSLLVWTHLWSKIQIKFGIANSHCTAGVRISKFGNSGFYWAPHYSALIAAFWRLAICAISYSNNPDSLGVRFEKPSQRATVFPVGQTLAKPFEVCQLPSPEPGSPKSPSILMQLPGYSTEH